MIYVLHRLCVTLFCLSFELTFQVNLQTVWIQISQLDDQDLHCLPCNVYKCYVVVDCERDLNPHAQNSKFCLFN